MPLLSLGKNPSGALRKKVTASTHFYDGEFQNIEPTTVIKKGTSYFKMIGELLTKPKDVVPKKALPTQKTDLKTLIGEDAPQVVWFGHSSYLIVHKGKTILVDPVLANASPFSLFGAPFPGTNIYSVNDLPHIDVLVITHDHYDHLDSVTLRKLKNKIGKILCPLGVSSHLLYWGFDEKIISELDWHEKIAVGDFTFTAWPARHFSGRLIKRNQTLWNSYVLEFSGHRFFLGGDSGYDGQFKIIGETYGVFDLVFIECGQYGRDWPQIHMFPEETAQAALDLKTKVVLPVHWGKFALAMHSWNAPIQRLLNAAEAVPYKIVSPKIGETYTVGVDFKQQEWWNI